MSHSNTARMLGYWEARRGVLGAPLRSSIDPSDFPDLVAQAFIIGRPRAEGCPFRLAGALVEDLHGGCLAGADFLPLWSAADRPRLLAAIEAALARGQAVIAQAQGRGLNGALVQLEILLAPLTGARGQVDRLLGLYQPMTPLLPLQDQRIERLFLLDVAAAGGADLFAAPLRLASLDGRRIA